MRPCTIVRRLGTYPLADERSEGIVNARKDELYTVEFKASDVWGADVCPDDIIAADLFESYLEAEQ